MRTPVWTDLYIRHTGWNSMARTWGIQRSDQSVPLKRNGVPFKRNCRSVFPELAISLLTDKPELIEIGSVYLLTMFWSQYPVNKQKVVFGYLRSAGYVKTPMIITFIGIWCVRVGLVLLFGYLYLPIIWIWCAMNIDQWTREILAELFFRKKHGLNILQYAN